MRITTLIEDDLQKVRGHFVIPVIVFVFIFSIGDMMGGWGGLTKMNNDTTEAELITHNKLINSRIIVICEWQKQQQKRESEIRSALSPRVCAYTRTCTYHSTSSCTFQSL